MSPREVLSATINQKTAAIRELANRSCNVKGDEAYLAAESACRAEMPGLLADLNQFMIANGFRDTGCGYEGKQGVLAMRFSGGRREFSLFEPAAAVRAEKKRVARNLAADRAMEREP